VFPNGVWSELRVVDIRILFVSANPSSTARLELADELRQFQHSLSGHDVKLHLLPAAQPEDLRIAIKSKKIDVVHFSGHAKDEGILMRDVDGDEVLVPTSELKTLFAEKRIKLVVLNACETSEIADEIKDSVDTVIGTNAVLNDSAAHMLSKVFYSALGRGDSIGSAYDEATKTIRGIADGQYDVYTGHGLKNDESLLPAKAAKDKDVEIEPWTEER